ncbi:unnamed protein product [Symbiodinium sp. CCMP2456]|nr:unnamed protein product [Symbiodinium sp. CCMP2456]
MQTATYEYPVALGLAYILLVGCLIRAFFVFVGLPASVGVMLSGFIFQLRFQSDLFFARDELQGLSFFLVLLIAGLEIRSKDLQAHVFVMALLPASCELIGIAVYAYKVLEYTPVEGMVLGSVLVAMGDGLVIPKMKEFSQTFPDHPLPRLVFAWAPLEASFALTAFGVLTGLASPAHQAPTPLGTILLANFLRLVATLALGVLLGCVSCWFIASRKKMRILKLLFQDPATEGGKTEGFLVLISVTLIALSLGKGESGSELVPMGFCPGSMFQSELLVIITASVFANRCSSAYSGEDIVKDITTIVGQVWVFGQVFLFSMLGSKMTLDILPELKSLAPVMLCGLLARAMGISLGVLLTVTSRRRTLSQVPSDIGFCFLCTLPRATIQGALGAEPLKQHFFHVGYGNNSAVQNFTFTAARLYVLCYSVMGMILLNGFGPMLLRSTEKEESTRPLVPDDSENPSENTQLADSPLQVQPAQHESSTPQLQKVPSRSASSTASGESHWQDKGGMLHTFESRNSTWRPQCEILPGYKTTCRATASEKRPAGDEAKRVLKPTYLTFKVPKRSAMQRMGEFIRRGDSGGRVHEVPNPNPSQGAIPVILSSKWKEGKEVTHYFGPDPDFLVRADPSADERPMTFRLRTKGKVETITIRFPPLVKEAQFEPNAVMVEVPENARPGAPLVFKHPTEKVWLQFEIPQKVPANRFLAVALPSAKYVSTSNEDYCSFIHEMCDEIYAEFVETLQTFESLCTFRTQP